MNRLRTAAVPAVALAAAVAAVALSRAPAPREAIRDPLAGDALRQVMEAWAASEAFEAPDRDVRGAIVPHHLTAAESIAVGVRVIARGSPATVLLVSPDHFDACPTPLCAAAGTFSTPVGEVETDDALVGRLARSPHVTVDARLFGKEHGIGAVLPFLKLALPDARVVPVVVSDGWFAAKDDLALVLGDAFDRTGAFVVSSDFSHYLPLAKADAMDEATAETFFAGDLGGIAALRNPEQSDCPACLWLFATVAARGGFFNPSVLAHTNSARILGDESVRETTSHFAMAFFENDVLDPGDLAVAGDVTMTRTSRTPSLKPAMKAFWDGDGPRFVNLEGPLAEACPPNRAMFTFCNSERLWLGMRDLATHWAVENNHMLDRRSAGVLETKRIIERAGETWVGDAIVRTGSASLIAVTALMNPVADARSSDISSSYARALAAIEAEPASRFVIVLVHAGAEYRALASEGYRLYLRSFVDAGADAVVAAHAHVISDMEVYRGKPIFRGVGNFIFDQFEDVSTRTAMAVRLREENGRVLFETLRTAD